MTALQWHREQSGWSQEDLATRSGVDQSIISRLETGARPLTSLTIRLATKLAEALGISVEEALREDYPATLPPVEGPHGPSS